MWSGLSGLGSWSSVLESLTAVYACVYIRLWEWKSSVSGLKCSLCYTFEGNNKQKSSKYGPIITTEWPQTTDFTAEMTFLTNSSAENNSKDALTDFKDKETKSKHQWQR